MRRPTVGNDFGTVGPFRRKANGCPDAHNGSSYISEELAEWLEEQHMSHVRGAPYHPQTQGKIEHWHQTLKNRILLENYYLPGDLETQIAETSSLKDAFDRK